MTAEIKGCYPALVTPFEAGSIYDQSISYKDMDKLMEHVLDGGVNGVVVAGCTGSASLLTSKEQVELVKYVQKNFGKRTTVIAGDGSNFTKEAVELAKRMEGEAGVFTHLSISPYQNKPSDKGILEHYTEIANRIEGKVILYSVPGRTGGKGILPDVAKELADHPQIIGIKEASGDLGRIGQTIQKTVGKDFFVISGDDNLTLNIIDKGGVGVISVAANIAPRYVRFMVDRALAGHGKDALKLNSKLYDLYSALFPKSETGNASPNPVMCHYALRKIGIPVGVPRLPLTYGEEWETKKMDKALKKLGLI